MYSVGVQFGVQLSIFRRNDAVFLIFVSTSFREAVKLKLSPAVNLVGLCDSFNITAQIISD